MLTGVHLAGHGSFWGDDLFSLILQRERVMMSSVCPQERKCRQNHNPHFDLQKIIQGK